MLILLSRPSARSWKPISNPSLTLRSDRSARVHVRLNRHQQRGIEALGLAVRGVGLNIGNPCAEGHRPGGVDDKECGRAVGVGETPTGGVSSDKSTTQSSVWMILDSWTGDRGAGSRREVRTGVGLCVRSTATHPPVESRQTGRGMWFRRPRTPDAALPVRCRG